MFKSYLRLSNSSSLRFYSTKTLVKFENAQVHRFGAKEPAFRNLSLRLTSDDRLVIVGPVSAGKSTLAEVSWMEQ
jgi:molybdate transport system ATP-binding protein